jgi:hypothetical protein
MGGNGWSSAWECFGKLSMVVTLLTTGCVAILDEWLDYGTFLSGWSPGRDLPLRVTYGYGRAGR